MFVLLVERGWNNIEPAGSCWEAGLDVDIPSGGAITNHHTLQVHADCTGFSVCGLLVILVDLPGQIGHVDSGVGFTRYKELVRQIFWVFNIPLLEGSERILRLKHIVGLQVLSSSGMGVAYTSW